MGNEPASIPETRFRRVGAAPNEGGPVAASRHQSGRGGTTGEGESGKCSSLGESNAQEGAAAALRKAGRAGRKPRLNEKQLQQLEARLREGAEKAGFPNGLWTLERVAGVIREQFGVEEYHSGHVWWIFPQKLGWSSQPPDGRARERNEAAIRDWKENIWPALKKKPKKRAGSSSS